MCQVFARCLLSIVTETVRNYGSAPNLKAILERVAPFLNALFAFFYKTLSSKFRVRSNQVKYCITSKVQFMAVLENQ